MRRLGVGSCVLVASIAWSQGSQAAPLLDLSGRVALLDGALPDGVRVTLGLDLDRDGTLNSFELVEGTVAADGSYALSYSPQPTKVDLKFVQFVAQLAADYEARGFEAVLDDGPLPVILRFEREGYSSIVKRFTTLTDLPSLDVVLAPVPALGCSADECLVPDGSVHISGFPGGTGIARAYARRYDPSADQARFPGAFTSGSNLLISSGFTEVDLRTANGSHVSQLSSPVSVRFQTDPASWGSLRDLTPDSSRIEVPMYSFDETRGDWVSEPRGELESSDGTAIDEADFPSIQDGSYPDPVFVAFETSHFSTFNCDAPNSRRACVQGRLVTLDGDVVVGAQVSVQGVSYTGTAGTIMTGADGYFASDLMKSEVSGEDTDGNGKKGETFTARVTASGVVGVFVSEPFDTPQTQGTIGGTKSCRAPSCNCVDLGDIQGDFELPRACEISVTVTFSGSSITGSGGPLKKGDAVVGAKVTGEVSGGPSLPLDDTICGGSPCGSGRADADGTTTFVVPVVGDAPKIQVNADYSVTVDGDLHYYTGSATIMGCARGEDSVTETVAVDASHASLGDMGSFIAGLGDGPALPSDGGLESLIPKPPQPPSCRCRQAPARGSTGNRAFAFALSLVGLIAAGRRRARR